MKKILSLIITLTLVIGIMAGCNNGNNNENDNLDTPSDGNINQGEVVMPVEADKDLAEIIDKIYEIKDTSLSLETVGIDLKNSNSLSAYTGLSNADKLKCAVYSEPAISGIAYSLVLMRLNDASDAETVAKEAKEGINTAKWICALAEDLQVVAYQDIVMLIMVDTNKSETVTSDEIVSAFKTVCGGELSVELK